MTGAAPGSPGGPVRIVIPVYDQADLLDVCGPAEIFNWAGVNSDGGWEITVLAQKPGAIAFNNGFSFNVEGDLSQPVPCDAMWVPGGMPETLHLLMYGPDQSLIGFLRAQAEVSRMICSVCEGALLLARAGLLDGYRVTTHWAFIDYLQQYFPKVQVADGFPRFVLDRDRLTGGGISSGLDEAFELVRLLGGEALAQSVQQDTQYYPDPPVTSMIPHVRISPMPPPPGAPGAANSSGH
jgi:cyclohexyl-isocyanide hydratase